MQFIQLLITFNNYLITVESNNSTLGIKFSLQHKFIYCNPSSIALESMQYIAIARLQLH